MITVEAIAVVMITVETITVEVIAVETIVVERINSQLSCGKAIASCVVLEGGGESSVDFNIDVKK